MIMVRNVVWYAGEKQLEAATAITPTFKTP